MSLRNGVKLVYNAAENIIAKIFDKHGLEKPAHSVTDGKKKKLGS